MKKWLSETSVDDRVVLRIGRDGEELVAEWPEIGVLRSNRLGTEHTFEPVADADLLSVEKLQHGVVRAMLRHLRGELSLHASAVAVGERAALFVGESGSGKSTYAAYLGERGWPILADDVAHVERKGESFFVEPSEGAHFLMHDACVALGIAPDAERPKTRVQAKTVGASSKLAAMFSFSDADAVTVTRVAGFETIQVLSPCVARFVFDEPSVLRADLGRLAALLETVPLYRIGRPRGFEHLAEIEQRMLQMVEG